MKAKRLIVKVGIALLSFVFAVMKKGQLVDRVLIMSRQSNEPSLDIMMLQAELDERKIKSVVLCKKMGQGLSGKIGYLGELLKQMKYLATSKVVVLDSYNIPVSLFKHREGTKVIQMWHALGSMKKFGKSILDKKEGSSSELASLMKMHEGYDYILTSSELSKAAFAEAFGYPEEKLLVMSLPRVDALLDKQRDRKVAEKIYEKYPQLKEKKTILYAPTMRIGKDMSNRVERIIHKTNKSKYNLVIKIHPLTKINIDKKTADKVVVDNLFQTIDMLSVADYVITDYSAITYEAALKGLPIYFYAFDKEKYVDGRSFYLDYDKEMPGPIHHHIADVLNEIKSETNYNEYVKKSKCFADKYIEKREKCTAKIADFIEELL